VNRVDYPVFSNAKEMYNYIDGLARKEGDLLPGLKIGYRLGTGGFSIVYEGRTQSEESIAVKICLGCDPADSYARLKEITDMRYPDESKPFLTGVRSFKKDGMNVMVMPKLGPDAHDLFIGNEGCPSFGDRHRVSETDCMLYFLVTGLFFVHESGAYHGDVKLENLCISDSRDICDWDPVDTPWLFKLIDFAFHGHSRGTEGYAAPESKYVKDETIEAGQQRDIWALGVVFWVMEKKNRYHTLPWEDASRTNENFDKFLKNKDDFIQTSCGTSPQVTAFYRGVFDTDPSKRFSIRDVMNSFYGQRLFLRFSNMECVSPTIKYWNDAVKYWNSMAGSC